MNILFIADNFPPERNAQASRVFERARRWVEWGHDVTVITCAPNFPEGKVFDGYKNRVYQTEEMPVTIPPGNSSGQGLPTSAAAPQEETHQSADNSARKRPLTLRVIRVGTFIAPNSGTWLRILDYLSFMPAAFLAGLFQRRPDVLVVTSPQFFAAIAAAVLALFRRLPFVLELSDLWPDSIVAVGAMKKSIAIRLLEKLELWLYRRADRIIAVTNSFKKNLVSRGVPAGKIDVVINGVELSMYAPRPRDEELAKEWGLEPDHFVVGYIGTHGMAHALGNVLDAAALSQSERLRFLLVGPGAERENLLQRAESMNLRNVIFIPAQPKENMPRIWSLCDVALVHLRNTPLFKTVIPSKMFEAMGMGLPILMALPDGEGAEILAESGAGIWVPPEDPKALLEAAVRLETDHELRQRLAEQSIKSAPLHTRERQAREYLDVLEATVGRPPALANLGHVQS